MPIALLVVILGIVEGVTEYLPVSSTGHLILATELLGFKAEEWAVFNIAIQPGAILAIIVLYWRTFWREFIGAVNDIGDLRIAQVLEALNDLLGPHIFPEPAEGGDARACPSCGAGRLSLKVGKFGAFIGCSNYPECRYTRQLAETGEKAPPAEAKVLGTDPETGLDVTVRTGRFGPYVQLGEGNGKEKPKRASIPKGTDPDSLELERALGLLPAAVALARLCGQQT